MDAKRFYSVSFDARNHPKVMRLRLSQGGIIAYGRYQALLGILYDEDGLLDLNVEIVAAQLAYDLEFDNKGRLDEFLDACAEAGLISADLWYGQRHIVSESVSNEIEYHKSKAAAGMASGKARRKKKFEQEKSES